MTLCLISDYINFSLINIKRRKRELRLLRRTPRRHRRRRRKKQLSKLKRMVVCPQQAELQAMTLPPSKPSTSTKKTSVDRKIVMKLALQEVIALRTWSSLCWLALSSMAPLHQYSSMEDIRRELSTERKTKDRLRRSNSLRVQLVRISRLQQTS